MKKFIITSLAIAATVYLLALTALYIFQRSVLYIPPQVYLTPTAVELSGVIEVPDPTDQSDIMGWWLPPKEAGAPMVMYFHGNGSAVYSATDVYRTLQDQGYGVFALAYPGYPGRVGQITQQSLTEAAIEGYDFVLSQGAQADKIIYYGTSLGAGVAAQLATVRQPTLIIMEAPFTSAADMAQRTFPIFPASLLTKDKFRSDHALSGSQIPMIWLHGTHDTVIPFEVGQALFDGYDGPKTGYVVQSGEHTNLWFLKTADVLLDALAEITRAPSPVK